MATHTPLTTTRYFQHVAPTLWDASRRDFVEREVLAWPPDAFALAAGLLSASGVYTEVLQEWPPAWSRAKSVAAWADRIRVLGHQWRRHASGHGEPPKRVVSLLGRIAESAEHRVSMLYDSRRTAHALLELAALADEASAGAGVPGTGPGSDDLFQSHAWMRLLESRGATLCRGIDPAHLGVLPKMHTPQSGLTLRSLSHHLALYEGLEVRPRWTTAPLSGGFDEWRILLVPWPFTIDEWQFEEVRNPAVQMPPRFGSFNFRPRGDPKEFRSRLEAIVRRATEDGGRVDCIVMPECALSLGQFEAAAAVARRADAILIAGVAGPPGRAQGGNQVRVEVPSVHPVGISQAKHHRWRLDGDQLTRYGLESALDEKREWWEAFDLQPRGVEFVAVNSSLAFCVLICEDLARLEPVAKVVRSVGPNLVFALLLDGPQLKGRWPGRYATVLADDPGSSVLTLTSLGMAVRSRYEDPDTGELAPPSRVIALWKDRHGGQPVELSIDEGCEALLLTVELVYGEEWSADGRGDGGVAGAPILKRHASI